MYVRLLIPKSSSFIPKPDTAKGREKGSGLSGVLKDTVEN